MKGIAKTVTIGLAVLAAVALFSIPQAFAAKASFDTPPGEPPYGIAADAAGTKLYGQAVIKFTNISGFDANFEVVARLRKGQDDETFYADGASETVSIIDQGEMIGKMTPLLAPKVLQYFFNGETGLCVKVKRVENIDRGPDACALPGGDPSNCGGFFFDVMDIEIAVSSCP